MNSRLYTKKAAFGFAGILAALLIGCVFLNIFLIKPAVKESDAKSSIKQTDDGFLYSKLEDLNDGHIFISIDGYHGNYKNIIIPSEIEGYPVIEVGIPSNENIESVEIPNSVTKIESAAFSFCPNLKKVTIPESVTEIGEQLSLESNFIVYGSENSYAQQYCEENGIPFKVK